MTAPLRLATAAMGTRFEIVILPAGEAAIQERAAGEAAIQERAAGEAAIQEMEDWHRRLNRFAADSLLSHINRTAASERVRLDRETFELLAAALDVWRASGGAFDITVAPAPAGHRTSRRAVNLREDDWTIGFEASGVTLDLGGVAKGHALDCAGAVLRTHGVTAALLHGGTSSVLAIGVPPGTDGWRVAVGAEAGAPVIRLRDEALSVSDSQGQAALGTPAHILDPRTGTAIQGAGRVAVRGPSARLADAWSTALVVLGRVPDTFPAGYEARLATTVTV